MDTRDKTFKYVVLSVALVFFILMMYGGIAKNSLVNEIGLSGFICTIIMFIIITTIKKVNIEHLIKTSPIAQETEAIVKKSTIHSSFAVQYKVSSLTLAVSVDINGVKSTGYYKLTEEEIQDAQDIIKCNAKGYVVGGEDNLSILRTGDKIMVKYLPDRPQYCIVLKHASSKERENEYE